MSGVGRQFLILIMFIALLTPFFASASTCPNLYRNLSFGSRGQDVVELQNFLIAESDLGAGNNTGYFGRLTEAAVKSFQRRHNIVSSGTPSTTGYGAVGPRTRTKMASLCGGGNVSANFSAYPTSGDAPLTVNFSYPGPNSGTYSMEYGDGNLGTMTLIQTPCLPGSVCNGYYSSTHTYNVAGTYIVKLFRQPAPMCVAGACSSSQYLCDSGHACGEPAGTVTITVYSAGQSSACVLPLQPRIPAQKRSLQEMRGVASSNAVTLKFSEGSGIRLRDGVFTNMSSTDMAAFTAILNTYGISMNTVARAYSRSEVDLDAERATAQCMSGRALADANLSYRITLPQGVSAADLANSLNALTIVEYVEPVPVPPPLPAI